jgi:hypothetical protein
MPIVLMILGFVWWWPLGLLILGFLIMRKKFGYRRFHSYAGEGPMLNWDRGVDRWDRKMVRLQEKMERVRAKVDQVRGRGDWFAPSSRTSSGNRAFDDYRAETLKRLEDEQREFKEFLERLRFAKDRAEFDQFMAAQNQRPFEPDARPEAPPQQHG